MDTPILLGYAVAMVAIGYATWVLFATLRTDVPFVPTLRKDLRRIFELANIQLSDTVVELGSGDGRFILDAVGRFGARRGTGYDLSRPLVVLARLRARRRGVEDRATFVCADARSCDVSNATLVYLYLVPAFVDELAGSTLLALAPGARVLSSDFPIDIAKHRAFKLIRYEKLSRKGSAYLYERQ